MIHNVQVLRALAAWAVVLVHLKVILGLTHEIDFAWGVDLFFVISGFIMVYTTSESGVSPLLFLLRRIIRVAPLYWIVTFAVFLLAVVVPSAFNSVEARLDHLVCSLFFVPFEKKDGLIQPIVFLGWTLNYEMFFYALFSVGLIFRGLEARLAFLTGGIVSLVLIGTVVESASVAFRFYTSPILLEFLFGVGVGCIVLKTNPLWPARTYVLVGTGAVLALVLAGVVLPASLSPTGWNLENRAITYGPIAALVVHMAIRAEMAGIRVRSRGLIAQGDASYSLYLVHPFIYQIVTKILWLYFPPAGMADRILVFGIVLVVTMFAGLATHRLVEKPLGSFLASRLLKGRETRNHAT